MKTRNLRDGKKRERQPCYVCEKHEAITEWHHTIPLERVKSNISEFAGKNIRLVCLCPNCHTVVHALNSGIDAWKLTKEYTEEQFERIMSLRIPLE